MVIAADPITDSPENVQDLVDQLEQRVGIRDRGRCMKNSVETDSGQIITSWKFNEYDYGKENKIQLPCKARGLFTIDNRIVVRGYDKFFSVGEVAQTNNNVLRQNTEAPYIVTLKENGCLIMFSGNADGRLITCSKHATSRGSHGDHASRGEYELDKQLELYKKSKTEFAKFLYDKNLTAVAELCDDEFEEHVLSYGKEKSGLYLHGMNFNTIKFHTVPMKEVRKFGDEWGFKRIEYFEEHNFDHLLRLMQDCEKGGTFRGRELEGFVIRCKMNGNDFFFKYKLDEPYMLYRQFREATRSYFTEELPIHVIIRRTKTHKPVVLKYLEFLVEFTKSHPDVKERFLQGHGIIELRKLFLRSIGLGESEGMKLLEYDSLDQWVKELSQETEPSVLKYVVVSVSTLGCGKTTVFQTLTNLFPHWSHIQNDNISKSDKREGLLRACLSELAKDDVSLVLCDKNNHQMRERWMIFDQIEHFRDEYLNSNVGLKFVAVDFVGELDRYNLWKRTFPRVMERGDNHQSIKSVSDEEKKIRGIMQGFMYRFEPLDTSKEPDCLFDEVITLDVSNHSSLDNAKLVARKISETSGLIPKLPSDKEFKSCFEKALQYKPSFNKFPVNTEKKKKHKPPVSANGVLTVDTNKPPKKLEKRKIIYFGIRLPTTEVHQVVGGLLKDFSFWNTMLEKQRVQSEFHITMCHTSSAKKDPIQQGIFDYLKKTFNLESILQNLQESPAIDMLYVEYYCDVRARKVVISEGNIVCIYAFIEKFYDRDNKEVDAKHINRNCHITLATEEGVKPFKSNLVLQALVEKLGQDFSDGSYEVDNRPVAVLTIPDTPIFKKAKCFIHL